MNELQPYPSMKDSGLPWCPQVPSHWELKPNRVHLRRRKVLVGDRHPEHRLLSLTKQGVIVRDLTDNKGKFSSDMGTSQEVRPGDLVMCLFDVPETPRTLGLSQHAGMITGAYTVFSVGNTGTGQWLEKFYISMDDRKAFGPLYSGLRNTIPKQRFLGTKTPTPPPIEQAAIVRYLDYVDRRVRRLVRAKRELIALLAEQKQAIIHRAVTRGLDPDVPLKDSGVEWLDEVPEHWNLERGKSLFAKVDRPVREADEVVTCFRDGTVTLRKNRRTQGFTESLKEIGYQGIRTGDLVIHAMDAFAGAVGVADSDGKGTPVYAVCEAKPDADARYHAFVIREMARSQWILALATGIRERSTDFRFGTYASQRVPLPPLPEQVAIVAHLTQTTADIDGAVARASREIDLLNEYRTRLVADVVTGKLDVRSAAASLLKVDSIDTEDNQLERMFDTVAGEEAGNPGEAVEQ